MSNFTGGHRENYHFKGTVKEKRKGVYAESYSV